MSLSIEATFVQRSLCAAAGRRSQCVGRLKPAAGVGGGRCSTWFRLAEPSVRSLLASGFSSGKCRDEIQIAVDSDGNCMDQT